MRLLTVHCEAAVSATLALRVAKSVVPSLAAGRARSGAAAAAVDPFAEADGPAEPDVAATAGSAAGSQPVPGQDALPAEGDLA